MSNLGIENMVCTDTSHSHYAIKARERDESLHSQVTEVRNVLDTSATETRTLVSSEVRTVRSDIEEVAVKVAISQEGLQKDIQTSHDHLCQEVSNAGIRISYAIGRMHNDLRDTNLLMQRDRQHIMQEILQLNQSIKNIGLQKDIQTSHDHLYREVSHAGAQTSHGIERIQNDLRDINLLVQHNRQHTMQEYLQLNQSSKNTNSMLSQVLLLYSEREESLLESSLAQHPVVRGSCSHY